MLSLRSPNASARCCIVPAVVVAAKKHLRGISSLTSRFGQPYSFPFVGRASPFALMTRLVGSLRFFRAAGEGCLSKYDVDLPTILTESRGLPGPIYQAFRARSSM